MSCSILAKYLITQMNEQKEKESMWYYGLSDPMNEYFLAESIRR